MSVAGIAVPILVDIAARHGLPRLRAILGQELGAPGQVVSDVAESVLKSVAAEAGVPVDRLPNVPEQDLVAAATVVEDKPEVIEAYVKLQHETNRLLLAPLEAGKPTWTWAWLAAWQWFLMGLWAYTWVLVPVLNASLRAAIPTPNISDLANLTLAYLALHMGGHTVKDFAAKRWGQK